jgi:hypothetical protein
MKKGEILLNKNFTFKKGFRFNFVIDDFKNQDREDHEFISFLY